MCDVRLMDRATAEDIATWRYDGPYSMYDGEADAIESFLKPENQRFAVFDENNDVVGFCNFGEDARVPGFDYDDDALDVGVGVGMRPDLTGRGKGLSFVRAVFDFARRTYAINAYRVTIAAFNRRAQQLCLALGFREIGRFTNPEGSGTEVVVLRGVKEE